MVLTGDENKDLGKRQLVPKLQLGNEAKDKHSATVQLSGDLTTDHPL